VKQLLKINKTLHILADLTTGQPQFIN